MMEPSTPPPPSPASPHIHLSESERTMGMLCHLLGIITSATLGLGFLGPLILWLVKRHESAFIDFHGKEAINFQLTLLLAMVVLGSVAMLLMVVFVGVLLIPVIIVLGIAALIVSILACVAANRGEWYRYPWTIRFVH